ncbi:MAG: hypothetical protein N2D54_04150 [Chloroflexota bacterium]
MQFLLDPNVAYLVIVTGFILTVFAILAPGTGAFEIGAVFMVVMASWQIYNLPINIWALVVLAIGAVPIFFALRKKSRRMYLAIAVGLFLLGSVFLFRGGAWYQPAVNPIFAIIISLISSGILWIMTDKIMEARLATTAHDLEGLIGAFGEAKTAVQLEGSVYVGGELWTARSDKKVKEGSKIEVLSREGFILTVKEI